MSAVSLAGKSANDEYQL